MNKRFSIYSGQDYFALIICGALFICGCIAGTSAAGAAANSSSGFLFSFLSRSADQSASQPGFLPTLLNLSKYHLAALFFGFSVLGVFCLPILSAIRGFFLCFAISAIVRQFGGNGVFLALSVSGLTSLITIPCFFVLSVQSFSASLSLFKNSTRSAFKYSAPFDSVFLRRTLACFCAVLCAAIADVYLISNLTAFIASRIV